MTEAERMSTLFQGCELGHGTYGKEEKTPGKVKSEIKKTARTLRGPATVEHWQQHIDGERALGIIPVRTDGTCYWGVIDVDIYDLSHRAIVEKVQKYQLPMVLTKSKSGGAHLFLFVSEPVSCEDMMAKLRDISAVLGYGGSEIFPKQTALLHERGDLGNWLNMPYFKADGGARYAVDQDGRGLSLKRFLDLAEKCRLTAVQFAVLKPNLKDPSSDMMEGPPCLQHLSVVGVNEGGRNNALFAFGILAKKMKPDNWETLLDDWNQKYINPPLSSEEVSLIVRQLKKKEYNYKCKEPPLASHCDQLACRGRRFGIGPGGATPQITSVSVLDADPPLFFVYMADGTTVECSTDDIRDSRSFQRAYLNQHKNMLPLYKNDAWQNKMAELLDNKTLIEVSFEVSRKGAFFELLQAFLTDRYRAQAKEETTLGKPYFDEEERVYWFRLQDLIAFLETKKFKEYNRTQICARLKDMDGQSVFHNIKKQGVNLWRLPEDTFQPQKESHKTPRIKDAPI